MSCQMAVGVTEVCEIACFFVKLTITACCRHGVYGVNTIAVHVTPVVKLLFTQVCCCMHISGVIMLLY